MPVTEPSAPQPTDPAPESPGLTRWEMSSTPRGYGARFAELVESGEDIEGEARLADVLVPRGARVLDAGCGMGRIAAALQARGHRVVGVDLDAVLLAQAAATYPGLELLAERVESLSPDRLAEAGHPRAYDLVVCVGNVMILGAPDTERAMLAAMRDLLAPQGRILVGFHTFVALEHAREYAPDEFARDCAAVGLRVEARYAGYDLRPYDPAGDYAVHILSRTPTHE